MGIHETTIVTNPDRETVVTDSPVPRRRFESRYDNGTLQSLDFGALAVTAVMMLGPLFAYAVGWGA